MLTVYPECVTKYGRRKKRQFGHRIVKILRKNPNLLEAHRSAAKVNRAIAENK